MTDNVKDKNILITGGSVGIGYDIIQKLLEAGAKTVAMLDLSTSSGATSVANLEKQYGKDRVLFFPCDVTDLKQFEETFKKVCNQLKGLDIVINNAGILNDHEWAKTVDLNVRGLTHGSLLAIDHMGKHKGGKGGTIVNFASIVALELYPILPVYCASKHNVMAFSRCLQANYKTTGVRVLIICPGVTDTALVQSVTNKIFDFVKPEDVETGFYHLPKQPVDNVGRAVLTAIQKAENGAVWVSEANLPPRAVVFPPIELVEVKI